MNILRCPVCGGRNLHHYGVRVHSRAAEDEAGITVHVDGLHVVTHPCAPESDSRMDGVQLIDEGFYGRRNDLVILFECESCGDEGAAIALRVAQHKGETQLTWRLDCEAVELPVEVVAP